MANTGYIAGYITVVDAIRLLQAGMTLYVVSAPLQTRALPLEGGWVDDSGAVHYDCSAVVLNPQTAYEIGRKFNQQCIMRITPCANGEYEVYLLHDSAFTRQVALQHCGGYTADGEHLFTAVSSDRAPFEDAYIEWLPADIEFIPVK
jgi:hypothetical protein